MPSIGEKKCILVVEDDRDIRELLQRMLSRKYKVIAADDGLTGLSMAKENQPNLMLLDVMLPGKDGLALAKELKADPSLKRVPLLFLTAKDSAMDMIRGIQSGAHSYITKPFNMDDLVSRVDRVLGTS